MIEIRKNAAKNRLYVKIGNNILGKMQLARTSQEAGYKAAAVATFQEAEELLDAEKNTT